MDKAFTTWLGQEVFRVLVTPLEAEQRLLATRQFVAAIADKMDEIAPHERHQVVDLLCQWHHQNAIAGKQILNDKATTDWLEGIIGTIDGMIEQGS